MFQILMAVIGMTMAGALGYAMIEQQNMQGAMNISREDNRRLNLVVDMLSRNLVEVPAADVLMAPIGISGSYYQLPASINIITTNSQNVPFQYCPLAQYDQRFYTGANGSSPGTVTVAGGTSYNTAIINNGVAWTDAIYDQSVRDVSAVAIITSALKGSAAPPPCSEVKIINGKTTVANGLARIITIPSFNKTTRQTKAVIVNYYVTQNGSGNKTGKDASNTAVADVVWTSIYRNRHTSAAIYVVGDFTTGPNFNNYVKGGKIQNTDMQFISAGGMMRLPPGTGWEVSGTVTITNLNISLAGFYITPRGRLHINGTSRFFITAPGAVPFNVETNGQILFKNADVAVDFQGFSNNGILQNNGKVIFLNSAITAAGTSSNNLIHYLLTYTGGHTVLENSTIGKTAAFGMTRADNPVYTMGGGRMSFKNSSVVKGFNNECHSSIGTDTFNWSADGPGAQTGIPPETSYPAPGANYTQAEMALYSQAVSSRRAARENNVGSFNCVES